MSKFVVEKLVKDPFISWDYEWEFTTKEEAVEYITQEKKNWGGVYRIIQEIPYE